MKFKQYVAGRDGFTLIEVVIAVAIVAIMVGTIAPLVFRKIDQAREEATLKELSFLRDGMLEFYEDTGRFPTEGEGLLALLEDPGIGGWSGPYVDGGGDEPTIAVTTDSWRNLYQYDLSPTVSPSGATQALVVSAGGNQALNMGSVGATWTLASADDDLYVLVTPGLLEREKLQTARRELDSLGNAGRQYFADNALFPSSSAEISGTYLDAGLDGGAFVDPWLMNYELTISSGGTQPPYWILRSYGPNRTDDSGAGDDLTLTINSTPPARNTTMSRLEVAQLILNKDPNLALTGSWALIDRGALNLVVTFDNDGWGREYQLNVNSRLIFSTGPDGDALTVADNIPTGVGP